jgi:hypothetical protein
MWSSRYFLNRASQFFVALPQGIWLRYAGESGAPAWVLEHVGFDVRVLEENGAVWLQSVCS